MKQVVKTFEESIRRIEDISHNKIYAFRSEQLEAIYKLQCVGNDYAFCNLSNSTTVYGDNGSFRVPVEDAMKKNTVYEFDNLKEFAEWLAKEAK